MNRTFVLSLLLVAVLLTGAGSLVTGVGGDQPSCSATSGMRTRIYVAEGGASSSDLAYACVKDAAGSYAWAPMPLIVATATPIDVSSINDEDCDATNTLTWSGVTAGEPISVGVGTAGGFTIDAYASATNTVTLVVCNLKGSALDLASKTYTFERRLR